jgi:hypothetical protein
VSAPASTAPRVEALDRDACLSQGRDGVGAAVHGAQTGLDRNHGRLGLSQIGAEARDLSLEIFVVFTLGEVMDLDIGRFPNQRHRWLLHGLLPPRPGARSTGHSEQASGHDCGDPRAGPK